MPSKRTHAITPTDNGPPPNSDWRYSKPRVGRFWIDPCDHSKGSFEGVEIDACKWSEIVGPDGVASGKLCK